MKLETEKASLSVKLANCNSEPMSFEESFQTVFDFIGNPHKLWASGEIENQRMLLKLVFDRQLPYCRNSGFQTPEYSQPFKVSRGFMDGQSEMVDISVESSNSLFNTLKDWISLFNMLDNSNYIQNTEDVRRMNLIISAYNNENILAVAANI